MIARGFPIVWCAMCMPTVLAARQTRRTRNTFANRLRHSPAKGIDSPISWHRSLPARSSSRSCFPAEPSTRSQLYRQKGEQEWFHELTFQSPLILARDAAGYSCLRGNSNPRPVRRRQWHSLCRRGEVAGPVRHLFLGVGVDRYADGRYALGSEPDRLRL